jgi:hypothetical protein
MSYLLPGASVFNFFKRHRLTYAPFVAPFTVVVTQECGRENSWGWTQRHFWTSRGAYKYAATAVASPSARHASIYFKWRYAMQSKMLCRVVKNATGIHFIKEFKR